MSIFKLPDGSELTRRAGNEHEHLAGSMHHTPPWYADDEFRPFTDVELSSIIDITRADNKYHECWIPLSARHKEDPNPWTLGLIGYWVDPDDAMTYYRVSIDGYDGEQVWTYDIHCLFENFDFADGYPFGFNLSAEFRNWGNGIIL